jgi:hypothetical protein
MQGREIVGRVELVHNSITGTAARTATGDGRPKEIAAVVKNRAAAGMRSIGSAVEAVDHGLVAAAVNLKYGAVVECGAAEVCRSIKITGAVWRQARERVGSVGEFCETVKDCQGAICLQFENCSVIRDSSEAGCAIQGAGGIEN